MSIKINSLELKRILDLTPASQNIMLVGKHGIGKSQILETYFTKKGMKVVPTIRLSSCAIVAMKDRLL